MNNKTIIDIRYYEENIFKLDRSTHCVGERFARKLREFDFKTGEYDHVYIMLIDSMAHDHLEISKREDWRIHVNAGVSAEHINGLSSEEQQEYMIELTTNALRILCQRDGLDFAVVEKVKSLILCHQSELGFTHKVKETSKYKVVISYQIRPLNKASISFIEYTDKMTGVCRKKILTPLKMYEDIFYLVSSIHVSKGVLMIKPRTSSVAKVHLRSYETPILIHIQDLLSDHEEV